MSTIAEDATTYEIVTALNSDERECSNAKGKLLIRFWSLIALVSLFLAHGSWVIYGIRSRQFGSIERNVSLLFLVFYASTLPGCTYFAWRRYRDLKKA